jgi:transposase
MSHELRPNYAQMFLLPPSLDDWVAVEHPVRFVRDFVETLDLAALGFKGRSAKNEDGRPHYALDLLLNIWLFGWMEGVRTSRKLEKACLRDIAFLWLTGNLHPDHNTLWRFFAENKKPLRRLFKRVVQVAAQAGLVGFALHALDGTKMAAASSRDTALYRKTLEKELKKIDSIIDAQMAAAAKEEGEEAASYAMSPKLQDPQARKAAILEALAKLDAAKTDHLHPNEPEARMMKSRQMHTVGYNAQAVVDRDSDLIVATEVVTEQNDYGQLVPMLEQVSETTGRTADETVADTGYSSGEQLAEAEKRHLPVLVRLPEEPANTKEKGAYSKAHFRYDAERDVYICPQNEVLKRKGLNRSREGSTSLAVVYICRKKNCPVRGLCTDSKHGRTIKRSVHEEPFQRQLEKQRSEAKQILMSLRKEVIEHIFGLIKGIDGFRRFTVRGLEGVRAQWALACTALNLRKLYVFWTKGRLLLSR